VADETGACNKYKYRKKIDNTPWHGVYRALSAPNMVGRILLMKQPITI